jgi:ABC-type sulfate/molybdate transport systems ATPase subunit
MDEPNVLLLDEPTNDLDIETLTSLEDILDGWPGTLLVVSHDRYLLERACDKQIAMMGDGKIRELPGGVEQYLELRRAAPAPTLAPTASSSSQASHGRGSEAGQAPGSAAAPAASAHTPAELREARKDMARVEKQLARLTAREERIHAEMAQSSTDHAKVLTLNGQLRAIVDERETLELEWLAAAEIVG